MERATSSVAARPYSSAGVRARSTSTSSSDPEQDDVLRALPRIKDDLQINVELASLRRSLASLRRSSPSGRLEERSPSAGREGRLTFKHFDLYSQALAKLERGHIQDLDDVHAVLERGLVEADRLRNAFAEIEPQLYRFPAVDPADYKERVDEFLRQ